MDEKKMKKELQKLCKDFMEEFKSGEFPKAMMTTRQMELRTATINCAGGKWFGTQENSQKIREKILASKKFKEFVKNFKILNVNKENSSCNDLIIRLRY